MDGLVVCPCKPEEADGQGETADNGRRQTSLGRGHAAVGLFNLDVALVGGDNVRNGAQHADHDAEKGEAADALVPAAVLLVDDGEGRKQHVQRAVDDGHVHGQQKHNGLFEEQDPRAREGRLERLDKRHLAAVAVNLADVDFARHLGELGGPLAQQHGRIRLGDENGTKDPERTRKRSQEAHDPSPTGAHAEKAADDGTQDGAEERCSSKDGHGQPTLRRRKHVGNGAAGVGERRRAKGTSEKTQDQQRRGVLRARRARVERSQASVRGEEENLTAKHFAQRRPQQRTNGEPNNEKRYAERRHLLADVELGYNLADAARVR